MVRDGQGWKGRRKQGGFFDILTLVLNDNVKSEKENFKVRESKVVNILRAGKKNQKSSLGLGEGVAGIF